MHLLAAFRGQPAGGSDQVAKGGDEPREEGVGPQTRATAG